MRGPVWVSRAADSDQCHNTLTAENSGHIIMPVPETQGRMSHRADMKRAREEFFTSADSMTKKMEESWRRGINDNDRYGRLPRFYR